MEGGCCGGCTNISPVRITHLYGVTDLSVKITRRIARTLLPPPHPLFFHYYCNTRYTSYTYGSTVNTTIAAYLVQQYTSQYTILLYSCTLNVPTAVRVLLLLAAAVRIIAVGHQVHKKNVPQVYTRSNASAIYTVCRSKPVSPGRSFAHY